MDLNKIKSLTRILDEQYFPAANVRIERIPAGEDSENFLVAVDGGKFVLKCFSEVDRQDIGEELAAMRWLGDRGVPVPEVVATRGGGLFADVDAGCVVLLEYIEGEAAGDGFAAGLRIASFLADFHAHSSGYADEFCAARSEFARLASFAAMCREHSAYLGIDGMPEFLGAYEREVGLFEDALNRDGGEAGIIHHDLHGDNFLVDRESGAIRAMLDFSEAHKGLLVFDLAVLIGYWALDRERGCLDLEKCRQLLLAYDAQRPLSPSQWALLPHAVLLYFATDATGYILPKLRDPARFAISQCNMYTWFCTLRADRGWMDELRALKDYP